MKNSGHVVTERKFCSSAFRPKPAIVRDEVGGAILPVEHLVRRPEPRFAAAVAPESR